MNALLYIPPLAEGGGDVFGNLGINGVMLAAQIVNLIFLMLFLKPLLIDPLLKNLEARRKRIEDSLDNARKADERLANVEKDYDAKLEEAGAESQKARAEALRGAQVDADRVRADAMAEAEKIKAQGRVDASAERNQMLAGRALAGGRPGHRRRQQSGRGEPGRQAPDRPDRRLLCQGPGWHARRRGRQRPQGHRHQRVAADRR
jgi:ATP synthase F0 subunit b